MSFGANLQLLRRMRNGMTQEELAEKLSVSRQTISKWELDQAYPEMEKVFELCGMFSCTMDQLLREDMTASSEAYSAIRTEVVPALRCIRYTVVSPEPEDDALRHVRQWAQTIGLQDPDVIGWDFPAVSQEQINVHNMHGYTAALLLGDAPLPEGINAEVFAQGAQRYAAITIREPFRAPFRLIPGAYQTLMTYMRANGLAGKHGKNVIDCFEREYTRGGVTYMDVFIAVE